jgi:hypothetical protein
MKNLVLLGTVAVLSMGLTTDVQAQGIGLNNGTAIELSMSGGTDASANADTSANLNSDADVNVESNTQARTDSEADHNNSETNARGGVMVESETNVETNADETARQKAMETKADTEARIDAARGEASSRVQDLEGRTDTGVDASATTKIDIQ